MNKESAILKIMHTPGIGSKKLSRILRRLKFESYPVEEFVQATEKELTETFSLTKQMVEVLKSDVNDTEVLLEELWKHEIKILTQLDASYPEQLSLVLGEDAPPVLFVKGNLRALEKTGIGFCGSRKASEKGNQIVRSSAALIAQRGLNVVSGYAHGVDLAAHIGSLEAGGMTTFILPLGILNFQLKSSINSLLTEDNYLVISEFLPKLGWEVHNAMRRNLTICGLTKAIILVEPGVSGGTFEAGKTALKYERPLFVVEHDAQLENEGNKYFIQRGAKTLQENENGLLDIDMVIQTISTEALGMRQQSLF